MMGGHTKAERKETRVARKAVLGREGEERRLTTYSCAEGEVAA